MCAMTRNGTTMRRLSGLALGGALLLAPMSAALADEPTTAAEADSMAQKAEQEAARGRELGGPAYKGGMVQRAEDDASRYSSMAEEMTPPAETVEIISPEIGQRADVAEQYREKGAVAYKTGLVQQAENEQEKAEEEAVAAFMPEPENTAPAVPPDCQAGKPGAIPPGCPK